MAALYVMIPAALILVMIAVRFFFWAVDNGQFDDMEGPAHSILFDDDLQHQPTIESPKQPETSQDDA